MRDIRLANVDASGLEVGSEVLSSEESFSQSDGDGGLSVELLEFLDLTGKERLLDEEGLMRFEHSSKLLGHRSVNSS